MEYVLKGIYKSLPAKSFILLKHIWLERTAQTGLFPHPLHSLALSQQTPLICLIIEHQEQFDSRLLVGINPPQNIHTYTHTHTHTHTLSASSTMWTMQPHNEGWQSREGSAHLAHFIHKRYCCHYQQCSKCHQSMCCTESRMIIIYTWKESRRDCSANDFCHSLSNVLWQCWCPDSWRAKTGSLPWEIRGAASTKPAGKSVLSHISTAFLL